MKNIGNRNLPLKYTKGLTYQEKAEMTSKDFMVICHSFAMSESGFVFIPHNHSAFEILYVEEGTPTYICNEKTYTCNPGDLMIFNSMDTHACLFAQAPYKSRTIQFEQEMLASKFVDFCENEFILPIFTRKILFNNHIPHSTELYNLFEQVETEYSQENDVFALAIKGQLYNILVWLYRNALQKHESTSSKINIPQNQERFNQIIDYINKNYTQEIHPESIAKLLFIDKSYLSRIFKSYSGKTITEYVNTKRVLQAVSLLRDTQMTISQIAIETGFSDINYFSRIFKKIVGESPNFFRFTDKE